MSKEGYLYNYERFIAEVQANYSAYTEKDWLKADRRFNRFNDILTKRFGDKLTLEEKVRQAKARIIYDSCRSGDELLDGINRIFNGIKNYTDNHLSDDIDFLLEQGVKIGDILTDSIGNIGRKNR
jgi:hypothetical protein